MSQVEESVQSDSLEDEVRPKETSILFEPISFWILVVSLIGAIWFRFFPLIIVSVFLLILSLLVFTWKRQSLKKLKPTINVPRTRLFVGDDFLVHASVKNDKWLPLIWLEWEFSRSEFVKWKDDLQDPYIIRFLWLLWYQSIQWEVKGQALHRGVYKLGEVTLRSGDGFRFAEKEQLYDLNCDLYIYPKLISVQVPSFRTSLQWEVKGKQGGFVEDPLLINGIRDYEAGDEWQRFNWRASARIGKLQTNVYQPIVSEQLMTYFDVRTFVIDKERYPDEILKQQEYERRKREGFEKALSVIASVAMTYHERGMKVGFASNGLDHLDRELTYLFPSSNLLPYLDQLARMTQRKAPRVKNSLDKLLDNGRSSYPVFIYCERITEEHVLWYERNQHTLDIHFYYMFTSTHAVKLNKVAKQMDHLLGESVVNSS